MSQENNNDKVEVEDSLHVLLDAATYVEEQNLWYELPFDSAFNEDEIKFMEDLFMPVLPQIEEGYAADDEAIEPPPVLMRSVAVGYEELMTNYEVCNIPTYLNGRPLLGVVYGDEIRSVKRRLTLATPKTVLRKLQCAPLEGVIATGVVTGAVWLLLDFWQRLVYTAVRRTVVDHFTKPIVRSLGDRKQPLKRYPVDMVWENDQKAVASGLDLKKPLNHAMVSCYVYASGEICFKEWENMSRNLILKHSTMKCDYDFMQAWFGAGLGPESDYRVELEFVPVVGLLDSGLRPTSFEEKKYCLLFHGRCIMVKYIAVNNGSRWYWHRVVGVYSNGKMRLFSREDVNVTGVDVGSALRTMQGGKNKPRESEYLFTPPVDVVVEDVVFPYESVADFASQYQQQTFSGCYDKPFESRLIKGWKLKLEFFPEYDDKLHPYFAFFDFHYIAGFFVAAQFGDYKAFVAMHVKLRSLFPKFRYHGGVKRAYDAFRLLKMTQGELFQEILKFDMPFEYMVKCVKTTYWLYHGVQSLPIKFQNVYDLSAHLKDARQDLKKATGAFLEMAIIIEDIIHKIVIKDYPRALAMLYVLYRQGRSPRKMLKMFYTMLNDFRGLKKRHEVAFFNKLEEEGDDDEVDFTNFVAEGSSIPDLESNDEFGDYGDVRTYADSNVEEKSEEPPVRMQAVQAPFIPDVVLFSDSIIFKKITAVIMALTVPDILSKFPSVLQKLLGDWKNFNFTFLNVGEAMKAVISLVSEVVRRTARFAKTYDFRCFIEDGGIDTYMLRGHEFLTRGSRTDSSAPTLPMVVAQLDNFCKEGIKYSKADVRSFYKEFTREHHDVYAKVLALKLRLQVQIDSASDRKKTPFTVVMLGPPGVGKTTMNKEIMDYVLSRDPLRKGLPSSPTDMYTVPVQDKHWNLLKDPQMIVFNDVPNNGYNLTMMNIPEMLRIAADTCPFFTPQADISDKAQCVIDPKVVSWTSNGCRFAFGECWGNGWEKLVRRYPNIFYFAYPAEFYEQDIEPQGSDAGKLKPEFQKLEYHPAMEKHMRVYACEMTITHGVTVCTRKKFLGCGRENLLVYIKKLYVEHEKKPAYNKDAIKRCPAGTPVSSHVKEGDFYSCGLEECCYVNMNGGVPPEAFQVELQGGKCCKPVVVADGITKWYVSAKKEALMATMASAFSVVESYLVEYAEWAATFVAILASGLVIRKIMQAKKPKETVGFQAVVNPIEHNFDAELALRFGMAEATARHAPNPPKFPQNTRVYAFSTLVSATTKYDENFNKMIRSNLVELQSTSSSAKGYALFVDSNTIMMNLHVLKLIGDNAVVRSQADNDWKLEIDTRMRHCVPNNDIVFLSVQTYPAADLKKHFLTVASGLRVDGHVLGRNTEAMEVVTIDYDDVAKGNTVHGKCLSYKSGGKDGDCGLPIILNVNGKAMIGGIHVGITPDNVGLALLVTALDLNAAIIKFKNQGTSVVFQALGEVGPLIPVSKWRAAEGISAVVHGTIDRGVKPPKSRVKHTRLYSEFIGDMIEPKEIPRSHVDGELVNGTWNAPYVHKFKGMSIRMENPDYALLRRAEMDYLDGMPVDDLHPVNIDQAINGVLGDPYFKSMNLTTSLGVYSKFYKEKKNLIDREWINKGLKESTLKKLVIYCANVVFEHQRMCLKDEPVTALKNAMLKLRYFMIFDPENLILMRCFLGPIIAHMYRNKEFFECYGAFNPASTDYGVMYEQMRKFLYLVMADVKHFDSSHKSLIADAVARILTDVGRRCGYKEESLRVVFNLVRSLVFSYMEFNGDFAFLSEGLGSGNFLTFIFNCLVISLLYRMAWFTIATEAFRVHNKLIAGGDDSACSTNELKFDSILIKSVFRKYGYEMSPPTNKNAEMLPFYEWDDFVFLKRMPSVLEFEGKQVVVGKLDKDSVFKALCFEIPALTVSMQDREMQVVNGAQREFALHGKEDFEWLKAKLLKTGVKIDFLEWEYVMSQYVVDKLYDDMFLANYMASTMEKFHSSYLYESFSTESLVVKVPGGTEPCEGVTAPKLSAFQSCYDVVREESGVLDDSIELPKALCLASMQSNKNPVIGSTAATGTLEGTVNFTVAGTVIENPTPIPYATASFGAASRDLFHDQLKRAIAIADGDWTNVSTTLTTVDLLEVWRSQTYIANKLKYFMKWRGKPCLRFVVNGNPQSYGRMRAYVELGPGYCGAADGVSSNDLIAYGPVQQYQAHGLNIDPSVSTDYCLELPWVNSCDWNTTAASGTNCVIKLKFAIMTALASYIAGTPPSCKIKVYLTMNDVEVAGIQFQSERVEDSILSMGKTSSYSKVGALSTALHGAGTVAAMMGYDKPTIVDQNVVIVRDTPSYAYTRGRDPSRGLHLDPMNAVDSNSGIHSSGDGQLSDLVRRWGLISDFSWAVGDVTGALATVPVSPTYSKYDLASSRDLSHLAFCSNAFRYWQGKIKYKVEVIASPFHRGTLLISYNGGSTTITNDQAATNQTMCWSLSLNGTTSIEFEVDYDAEFPWLPTRDMPFLPSNSGTLRFFESVPITTGGSTSPLQVNVFACAGSDFALARPTMNYACLWRFQSEEEDGADVKLVNNAIVPIPKQFNSYFGEQVVSIKELCQQKSLWRVDVVANAASVANWGLNAMIVPAVAFPLGGVVVDPTPSRFNTFFTYFSQAFLGMKGGHCISLVPISPDMTTRMNSQYNNVFTVAHGRSKYLGDTASGYYSSVNIPYIAAGISPTFANQSVTASLSGGAELISLANKPSIDVRVADTNFTRFRPTRDYVANNNQNLWENLIVQYPNQDGGTVGAANIMFQTWHSVGDDFSFHYPMFLPHITGTTLSY